MSSWSEPNSQRFILFLTLQPGFTSADCCQIHLLFTFIYIFSITTVLAERSGGVGGVDLPDYMCFVVLRKAYSHVPRDIFWVYWSSHYELTYSNFNQSLFVSSEGNELLSVRICNIRIASVPFFRCCLPVCSQMWSRQDEVQHLKVWGDGTLLENSGSPL